MHAGGDRLELTIGARELHTGLGLEARVLLHVVPGAPNVLRQGGRCTRVHLHPDRDLDSYPYRALNQGPSAVLVERDRDLFAFLAAGEEALVQQGDELICEGGPGQRAKSLRIEVVASRADEEEEEEEDQGPPTKRPRAREAGQATSSSPLTLRQRCRWPFHLLRTRGCPPGANEGPFGIRFADLARGRIRLALLSNYQVDLTWLFSACPALAEAQQLILVHGHPNEAEHIEVSRLDWTSRLLTSGYRPSGWAGKRCIAASPKSADWRRGTGASK